MQEKKCKKDPAGSLLKNLGLLKPFPAKVVVLGRILPQDTNNVVVIGTRKMTEYGQRVIRYFVPKFVQRGYTIISGLALGCDSYAQEVTLLCGGRTIGVLGYGINRIKNDFNYKFIKYVIEHKRGVVISPFDRDLRPSRSSFIYRNSVMAALGNFTIVIEAGEKSGCFHTVNYTLDFGKDVFAVPGDIFEEKSKGCNELIGSGAYVLDNGTLQCFDKY